VRHFSKGLPAAQEARRQKPELILMDFNLPDVDGRTLSTVLVQQLGGVNSPPIIACTARVGTIEAKLAEQFGCAAFLRKPFSPEDLLALVERFVPPPSSS
jgi:two-component system catabolic regulation response regulator CreB